MSKNIQFSKERKKHIYKEDECAGCHKSVTEENELKGIVLPYSDRIEYIVLCKSCVQVSRENGVHL